MKVFWLRSLYETTGIGFENDTKIALESGVVRFVRSASYGTMTLNVVGKDATTGKKEVVAQCLQRQYQGSPFLLEILVTEKHQGDQSHWYAIRRELVAHTEAIAALLHWVSPGTVGRFIVDGLLNREESDSEAPWCSADVRPFRASDYYEDAKSFADVLRNQEKDIAAMEAPVNWTVNTAMRWRYRVEHISPPVDKYVGLWIAIEAIATRISNQGGIEARISETIQKLYRNDLAMSVERQRALRKALCQARYRVVHRGDRDLESIDSLVGVAESIVNAGIRYLLGGRLPQAPPGDDLLKQLGV